MASSTHPPRNPRRALPGASHSSSSAVCAARKRDCGERRNTVSGPEPPEGRVSLRVVGTFLPLFCRIQRLLMIQIIHRKASFVEGNGHTRRAGAVFPPDRAAVPSRWSAAGGTHPHERERLPSPPARGLSRRWRCGARRGGTLHGGGSAGLRGLAPARCCPRRPGGLLPLGTAGA